LNQTCWNKLTFAKLHLPFVSAAYVVGQLAGYIQYAWLCFGWWVFTFCKTGGLLGRDYLGCPWFGKTGLAPKWSRDGRVGG
jgi:hypothetical protein